MIQMDLLKLATDLKKLKLFRQTTNVELNKMRPLDGTKSTNPFKNPPKLSMEDKSKNLAFNAKSQISSTKIINSQRKKLPNPLTLEDFIHLTSTGKLFYYFNIDATIGEFFDQIIKICCDFKDFLPSKKASLAQQLIAQQQLTNNNSININYKCNLCRWIKFKIATHHISLSSQGEVCEVTRLDQIPAADSVQKCMIERRLFEPDIQETEIYVMATDMINRITKFGLTIFCGIDMIDSIESLHQKQILTENLYFSSKEEAIIAMKMLVNKAERILSSEPRVLNVII